MFYVYDSAPSQDGLQSFILGYRVLADIGYIISNLHIRPTLENRRWRTNLTSSPLSSPLGFGLA